jgi:predicted RNA-binding Zn-ribbon protein involved in translation (DUF1610 family)
MSKENVPQTVPQVREHFKELADEPEIIQKVRDQLPTHFFVDDQEVRHHAWCSHCGEWVYLDKSRHQAVVSCPNCGAEGNIIHMWRGYKHLSDKILMYVYGKSTKAPADTITARAIYMEIKWYQEDDAYSYVLPWDVEPYTAVDSYYVFVYAQGAAQARNIYKCSADWADCEELLLNKSITPRFGRYMNAVYGCNTNIELIVDNDSVDEAACGTDFQYIWDEIGGAFTDRGSDGAFVRLFDTVTKHPFATEMLAKMGSPTRNWLYALTECGATAGGLLNWKGKTMTKVLRYPLCKEEKHWLRTVGAITTPAHVLFDTWQWLRKTGENNITLPEIERYKMRRADLYKAREFVNLYRLTKYFARQQEKHQAHTITLDLYVDYIDDCRALEIDLTKKSNLLPKDLTAAHVTLRHEIEQRRELQQEEERRRQSRKALRAAGGKNQLYKKLRPKILRKYAFEADGMMIYVPKRLEELIDEGIAMHSCVGTYVDRVAAGRTIVVFIRSQENHKERIGTMEISRDGSYIVQARAKYNRNLPPEADAFVRKFKQAKIDTGRKTA